MDYGRLVPVTADPADGSFRRSMHLFRLFRREQTEPARFYSALARDSVRIVRRYADVRDATVVDVGGGPGYFRDAFEQSGARYMAVDTDVGELSAAGEPGPNTLVASGMALPLQTGSIDVCFSSNVLEHVPRPWQMADEMVRVARPGGVVVLSYTAWWGPWGGHETAPWHYLGGRRAADTYRRRHGHGPKNDYGSTLFAVTVAEGLSWARGCAEARLVAAEPRYLPQSLRWVVRVPAVREVATWNLLLVLRVT